MLSSMQMAKITAREFPGIPQKFQIPASKKCIQTLREQMAEEILKGSGIKELFNHITRSKN